VSQDLLTRLSNSIPTIKYKLNSIFVTKEVVKVSTDHQRQVVNMESNSYRSGEYACIPRPNVLDVFSTDFKGFKDDCGPGAAANACMAWYVR
jgi:hypothetical protein